VSLPAVDLPISRTGLQVFYPPFYKVSVEAGAFHVENYENPHSATLNGVVAEPPVDAPLAAPAPAAALTSPENEDNNKEAAKKKTLVDTYRAREAGISASGIMPLRVMVPAFGPSIFLISQLTSENQSPTADFSYQQEKKAGGK
jgi:hypothetical protein